MGNTCHQKSICERCLSMSVNTDLQVSIRQVRTRHGLVTAGLSGKHVTCLAKFDRDEFLPT